MNTPSTGDAGAAKPAVSDVQAIIEFSREFVAARLSHIATASTILETSVKMNENGASFYEKVILFDGATIALSLSFLGYLTSHPAVHVPTHAFLWLVCPAWVLLLVSIYCCYHRVIGFHNTNVALLKHFSALSSTYHYQHVGILLNRVSSQIKAGLPIPDSTADAKQLFSELGNSLMKQASEESKKIEALVSEATKVSRRTAAFAMVGTIATILAEILLCIFSVRTVLPTL